jgi:ABC-type glycerol-3-phosphate transport system substrate-binding protein
MRKYLAILLAVALLAAACGDDSDGGADDPGSIDSCEELADATIVTVQQVIDIFADLSAEEMAAMMSGEMPESIATLEATGDEFAALSEELECTDLGDLLAARADQLSAAPENGLGQMVIESIRLGEEDIFSRLSR